MEEDIYAPPKANLSGPEGAREDRSFYVVSLKKFWILTIGTAGLYLVYWFIKHWKNWKLASGERLWPFMRMLFSVFFVHHLFRLFEEH